MLPERAMVHVRGIAEAFKLFGQTVIGLLILAAGALLLLFLGGVGPNGMM